MKYTSLILILFLPFLAYSQTEKVSIGLNTVPIILNRTIDISFEYRFDSTKSITINLGATFNNTQDYALCIQCADRPRIQSLDAYSTKLNFRKYYKNKGKNQKFYSFGAVFGYYNKGYDVDIYSPVDKKVISKNYKQIRYIFSPNIQLGRSLFLNKYFNLDFGTQLNFPIKYKAFLEPSHYTPTRGMGVLNFFLVIKLKPQKHLSK